jgi:hypothetical protein
MLEDKEKQIISENEKILEMVIDHGYLLNKEFVLELFNNIFSNVSEKLKNDKEVVLTANIVLFAVQKFGSSIGYASNKNDRDVVLNAFREYGCSIQFASEELKNE